MDIFQTPYLGCSTPLRVLYMHRVPLLRSQDHEKILFEPKSCINIPPRHYCCIQNPVILDADGKPMTHASGSIKVWRRSEWPAPYMLLVGTSALRLCTCMFAG